MRATRFSPRPTVIFECVFPINLIDSIVENEAFHCPCGHVVGDVFLASSRAVIGYAEQAVHIGRIKRSRGLPEAKIRLDMLGVHRYDVHANDVADAQFVTESYAIDSGAGSVDEGLDAIPL